MIPLDELELSAWYYGDGRLGPVAMWNGRYFMGIGYSWGQYELNTMEYGKRGYTPYAVIDRTFTPEVLRIVNEAIDDDMGLKLVPQAPELLSLQDLSVIQQFLIRFMEVGTSLLNVETQKEHLKVALTKLACSRSDDANELRQLARQALGTLRSLPNE